MLKTMTKRRFDGDDNVICIKRPRIENLFENMYRRIYSGVTCIIADDIASYSIKAQWVIMKAIAYIANAICTSLQKEGHNVQKLNVMLTSEIYDDTIFNTAKNGHTSSCVVKALKSHLKYCIDIAEEYVRSQ